MVSNCLKGLLSVLLIVLFTAACGQVPIPVATPTTAPTKPSLPNTPTATLKPTSIPATPTATAPPATATSESTPTRIPGILASIHGLYMLDAQNGWGGNDQQVLRTTDGGVSWVDVTPASQSSKPTSSFFLSPTTAWLLFGGDPGHGTLYHTTDGGDTWTSTSNRFDNGFMQFVDPNNGWILKSYGAATSHEPVSVFRTSDGGVTWSEVFTDFPFSPTSRDDLPYLGDKTGLVATDTNHAWVSGTAPVMDFIYIYMTEDGGRTWTEQDPALPAGYEGAMTVVSAPHFFSRGEAILQVNISKDPSSLVQYLYASHDGGRTWTAQTPLPILASISMPTATDYFVWDGSPTLFTSHNGGATWEHITANIDLKGSLKMFQFVDAQTGWAVASDASETVYSLYRTLDGGASWALLKP